jgi:stage IV sporulation protein FB
MISIPGRIPILIHPLFWLIAFFIGWMWTYNLTGALLSVVIILVSVLFHEFGHALTAILFGQTTRIELAAFGGFTYREGRKLKLWEEFLVVMNGPIAGFILFLIAYGLNRSGFVTQPALALAVKLTTIANLFWTIINLVPVLPLDGGHLMSIILEAIFGFKGVKIAIVTGIVIAVAISIFFLILGQFLVGALFLILTFESFRSLRYYKIFNEKDRDTHLQTLMQEADADFQAGHIDQSLEKLASVRDRTQEGILYTLATQEMAQIFRDQERYEEAYHLLLPIASSLSGESLSLFHFLAYMMSDFHKVIAMGNTCFQNNPTYDTALINALAHGALEEVEPAIGWLECAQREGLPSLSQAISREEFDLIRQDPRFLAFQQAHKA